MSATDHSRCRRVAVLALVLLPPWAHGQSVVTEADIARAQRNQPIVSDADIARAQQQYALPASAERAPATAQRRPLNIDALPVPGAGAPLDLGKVAEGFLGSTPLPSLGTTEEPTLLVFVSLSMPEPALRRLISQAARARAPLLVRGLVGGSLRQTAARLQALIGQGPGSIQIDPRPFSRYGIEQVPAFVLTRGPIPTCSEAACTHADAFVRTSGDVSLNYALAYMQRTAPAWAPAATIYLQRLEQ